MLIRLHQTEAPLKGEGKGYSHSKFFSSFCGLPVTFFCLTLSFSALLLRDRALQTIKWFKWLHSFIWNNKTHKISIGIHIGPAVYLYLSPILKSITRRLNLDLPVGGRDRLSPMLGTLLPADVASCCSPRVWVGFYTFDTLLKTAIGHRGLPLAL